MEGKTKLDQAAQERVVLALVKEYAWMGVNAAGAWASVAAGDWDDHPAARSGGDR